MMPKAPPHLGTAEFQATFVTLPTYRYGDQADRNILLRHRYVHSKFVYGAGNQYFAVSKKIKE
jgi:hypothetical protein